MYDSRWENGIGGLVVLSDKLEKDFNAGFKKEDNKTIRAVFSGMGKCTGFFGILSIGLSIYLIWQIKQFYVIADAQKQF